MADSGACFLSLKIVNEVSVLVSDEQLIQLYKNSRRKQFNVFGLYFLCIYIP